MGEDGSLLDGSRVVEEGEGEGLGGLADLGSMLVMQWVLAALQQIRAQDLVLSQQGLVQVVDHPLAGALGVLFRTAQHRDQHRLDPLRLGSESRVALPGIEVQPVFVEHRR